MVHGNAEPSFTQQSPRSLNQHCLLNSTPFPRVWSCLGREVPWSGLIPCRVLRQCLWGERGSPCLGSLQMCAQRPCSVHNPSLAHRDHPKLMTACLEMLISGLLHQPGVIPQQPQSCWFHDLQWNSHFSRASQCHSHVCFGKLQSLNAHSRAGTELWAVPVEQEIPNPVGHTLPGDLAHTFGLVFNSPTF